MKYQVIITLQDLAHILINLMAFLNLFLSGICSFVSIIRALAYHIVLQMKCLNIFVSICLFIFILVYLHFSFCYMSRH